MPDSAKERYRRAGLRLPDYRSQRGRRTGHAMMFGAAPVVDFGDFEEGGGFPVGFLPFAYRTLGVTDPVRVLHICSGSVRGPFTVDRRTSVRPAVVADARALKPGGRLGLLHYMIPPYSSGDVHLVGIWGISVGPGSTIRAWTVLEKPAHQYALVDVL